MKKHEKRKRTPAAELERIRKLNAARQARYRKARKSAPPPHQESK